VLQRMIKSISRPAIAAGLIFGTLALTAGSYVSADDFPPFEKVSKDYRKVVSTADGQRSLYTLYRNDKDQQLLAELPRSFDHKKIFIATSVAGGSTYTGWQWMDMYVYWTRIKNKLVLMEPELQYQSHGSQQIDSSVERTYTDRMILSVPIVSMGPGGGPVIDLDALLVGQSSRFGLPLNSSLTTIDECKAFPQNLEIAFKGPGSDGRMTTIHYSISSLPKTDYKPREADERIGYFLTVFKDFNKQSDDGKQFVRYINRWNLKKRDASLKMSPPEKPIIFYIEHTVPVVYRRYVRDAILDWNKAFRTVGIDGAIEVRQQDAKTGAYMDFDPEDVRYNFFRWITSESAFAMGPSRVNPTTGEILDADIIFDDSMARYYALDYQRLIAELPSEDESDETRAWLKTHPRWDPRMYVTGGETNELGLPVLTPAERSLIANPADHLGDIPDTAIAKVVQQNRYCNYAIGMAHQLNMARLSFSGLNLEQDEDAKGDEDADEGDDKPKKEKVELIDGVPEHFMAQIIKEIVMHEVGHTLGLRHNFKASTWKTLEEMNSEVGEPMVASVMDYNPINIAPEGTEQGDYITTTIGPYDYWAIQYGYTTDPKLLKELPLQSAQPDHVYATDEDASGPDPLARRFDMGKDPVQYAQREVDEAKQLRKEILDRAVKKGEAWYRARSFYNQLLYQQAGSVNSVSRFIGGTYINRDRKGQPDARPPLVPVEAGKQREALQFVIDNTFYDDAYDLDPDLLKYLATDKFNHWGNSSRNPLLPVHSMVMNIQRGALLNLLNPRTLNHVYDNEAMTPEDQDALTIPELMGAVTESIWKEVLDEKMKSRKFTNREPMISSLRRNLQREYIADLIDLSQNIGYSSPPRAAQAIAQEWMNRLNDKIENLLKNKKSDRLDDYTRAHLKECNTRLTTAINAIQTYQGN